MGNCMKFLFRGVFFFSERQISIRVCFENLWSRMSTTHMSFPPPKITKAFRCYLWKKVTISFCLFFLIVFQCMISSISLNIELSLNYVNVCYFCYFPPWEKLSQKSFGKKMWSNTHTHPHTPPHTPHTHTPNCLP